MSGMKNALMDIYYCQVCNAEGWIDDEPCACNPYEFEREELLVTFDLWNKELDNEPIEE